MPSCVVFGDAHEDVDLLNECLESLNIGGCCHMLGILFKLRFSVLQLDPMFCHPRLRTWTERKHLMLFAVNNDFFMTFNDCEHA